MRTDGEIVGQTDRHDEANSGFFFAILRTHLKRDTKNHSSASVSDPTKRHILNSSEFPYITLNLIS